MKEIMKSMLNLVKYAATLINQIKRINYEKYLIEKNSKRLLELKFEENHLIKSKCLKLIVKKYIAIIIKHGTKKKKKKNKTRRKNSLF